MNNNNATVTSRIYTWAEIHYWGLNILTIYSKWIQLILMKIMKNRTSIFLPNNIFSTLPPPSSFTLYSFMFNHLIKVFLYNFFYKLHLNSLNYECTWITTSKYIKKPDITKSSRHQISFLSERSTISHEYRSIVNMKFLRITRRI